MRRVRVLIILAVVAAGFALVKGVGFVRLLARWRELDRTYAETFPSPAEVAPALAGRTVLFHVKTGLDQDDSQICVGFNIILASLESRAKVIVIFDAGAVLDLTNKRHNLERTRVPIRLRKLIVAQTHIPEAKAPVDYGQYLDLLHDRGATVYANTAMNIVIGASDSVQTPFARYPYVQPILYAGIAAEIAKADVRIVY